VIMPSLHEGLPLTLIEEQANGLNAIVSNAISRDADMTGHITFLPLEKGEAFWSDKIISQLKRGVIRSETYSQESIDMIRNAGYDINSSAKDLEHYYNAKFIENNE
ncbi:MAG: hypothetical protein K2L44_07890, partial [Duncaniella sp.]|nr:hypothetical protein [Duncaniella sp.]